MEAVMIWLLTIGSVWGTTNALIKRGAVKAQEKQRDREQRERERGGGGGKIWVVEFVRDWVELLRVWEYSVPFAMNLAASVFFMRRLGDSPINIAVPVTNATTFAATALAGAALGERIPVLQALAGVALIAMGIVLCISPGLVTHRFALLAAAVDRAKSQAVLRLDTSRHDQADGGYRYSTSLGIESLSISFHSVLI
ncbi:hypothetical protein Mp_1g05900 [Marchantia polymorpha subsp. ruderalis]|uniref:EamA domain-containing protein n=2 Tax=Marchantia polymorpha TaxID=3197 RepID=A0AAF6ALZ0_MARPO|nr:hypothetical protein MARPO_0005s0019 [Marchantia polymorpha]BBM97460.1 hypothetical protein Mp_1g05900 [Marchantia polymorpha subsp. ruderalis]|eukprot:PTQ48344.1 hypothetical protein MARPO_0005s0019 [Marchantia polymorpha]